MSLSFSDAADLRKYFGRGSVESAAFRSTFGSTLERQEGRYYDSSGERIPTVERRSWVYIHVKETRSTEPSYEIDPASSGSSAVTSRRLRALSDVSRAALETYYGDIGEHWRQLWEVRRKIGCLFHLTEIGRELVARARATGRDIGHPHRVLEEYWRDQDGSPTEEREQELRLMEHAARRILADAEEAFRRTQ